METISERAHLWQNCLHEGEHGQHQVTRQQSQGLHTAAQSSLQSLRRFGSLTAFKHLRQEAQANPLVPREVGGDASPVLQHGTLHDSITGENKDWLNYNINQINFSFFPGVCLFHALLQQEWHWPQTVSHVRSFQMFVYVPHRGRAWGRRWHWSVEEVVHRFQGC